MKVAVYHNNNDIRIEEYPEPHISIGEILVRMKACGICGTDVMEWYRIKKAPRVLGHEMAGEIAVVGEGIEGISKGDRVFVSHHVPCFNCRYCLNGKYTACESLHSGNYYPGGFAEFIRIPKENVRYGTFLLPDNVSFEDASMIEPLGCVIAGQNQVGLKKGQTVLIIGSGISGLLHIQLAKARGAHVIATDINEYRLNKAVEFGADYAINATKYSADELKKVSDNKLADVVIVCAGAKQAVEHAMSSVDRKGTLLFFAIPGPEIILPSDRLWRDEITLTFSYGAAPGDLKEALMLIESGQIDVKKMITHKVSLPDIQHGFKLVSEAKDSLKVVVFG